MPQVKKQDAEITAEALAEQETYIRLVRDLMERAYGAGEYFAYTHSYGCQQNVSDGERINEMLARMGFSFCEDPSAANFVLYNTCAVRESAEDRVYGNVGALKNIKAARHGMVIALCGCMVQQESAEERIRKSFPYVDLVFGTHVTYKFPQLLYHALTERKRVFDRSESGYIPEGISQRRQGKLKAYVPIMYGCDNFCSYCIVPYVRGRERSRRSEMIVKEVAALVREGYRDITLLGQNVNSYGKGLEETINFSGLLKRVNEIEGDFRIRFMTSHPKDATRELIDTMASCSKVCRHLHLPFQSGSDRILKEMNRRYTAESYRAIIDYAREKMPDLTFSSDVIVGFPGETYEDFLKTMEMLEHVRYETLFMFQFSPRKGTPAAQMDDPVSHQEKGRWFDQLLKRQEEISFSLHQEMIGKTVSVLVEGPGRSGAGTWEGRSSGNTIVGFDSEENFTGHFVNVQIKNARNFMVSGDLIK